MSSKLTYPLKSVAIEGVFRKAVLQLKRPNILTDLLKKISPVIYTACNNLFQMVIYVCVFIYLLFGLCVYLFS